MTNGAAIGGRLGEETYRDERRRFDSALAALAGALGAGTWDLVAEAERRDPTSDAHLSKSARNYLGVVNLADPRPDGQERYNRGLLVKAMRRLFRRVLTRADAGDGRYPWCHVEEAYPDLAAEVMAHADLGSAFPLSKEQLALVEGRR